VQKIDHFSGKSVNRLPRLPPGTDKPQKSVKISKNQQPGCPNTLIHPSANGDLEFTDFY
jgi:hypothetical protein